MRSFYCSFVAFSLLCGALAVPAPAPMPAPALLSDVASLAKKDLTSVVSGIASAAAAGNSSSIIPYYEAITPTASPTTIAQVQSMLQSAWPSRTTESNWYGNVATMIADSLAPSNIASTIDGITSGEDSTTNNNPPEPSSCVIYPKKNSSDAPYSLSEMQLREAIYIPSTFTYGQKQPMIMVPGTASYGGITFAHNLRKLFTGSPYADPLWLNVPGALLGDAQVNAEYVAYAINYINCITNRTVSVVSWSQGGLDTQWAFKYWPSTRESVTDFMPVSPDFHGTVFANGLCISAGEGSPGVVACDPSVIQQEYNSNFVTQLRKNGGDSAYVPTTTLYSGFFDEIVEPQQGTDASAYLLDARGVGVTNNEVQLVCPGQPAGGFYTHESMLFNPVTYALMVDALTHAGPGQPSRAVNATVCGEVAAPGLTLEDVIDTEALIPIAAVLLLTYEPKLLVEPPLMAYATY